MHPHTELMQDDLVTYHTSPPNPHKLRSNGNTYNKFKHTVQSAQSGVSHTQSLPINTNQPHQQQARLTHHVVQASKAG